MVVLGLESLFPGTRSILLMNLEMGGVSAMRRLPTRRCLVLVGVVGDCFGGGFLFFGQRVEFYFRDEMQLVCHLAKMVDAIGSIVFADYILP